MTATLVDYALVTVEEATAFLTPSADVDVIDLINRATDYCEEYCNRPLMAREFEDLRLPAQESPYLRLRVFPIDVEEDIVVYLDNVLQTVWKTEDDGDQEDFDVVVGGDVPGVPNYLYRHCGWLTCLWRTPNPIRLTYTGGFATAPGHLRDAAFLVIENVYNHQSRLTRLPIKFRAVEIARERQKTFGKKKEEVPE